MSSSFMLLPSLRHTRACSPFRTRIAQRKLTTADTATLNSNEVEISYRHWLCFVYISTRLVKRCSFYKLAHDQAHTLSSPFLPFLLSSDDKSPSCQLDGFAGTFDAVLYKDVHLSTYPPTHSPNMFSWFPLFFPLQHPVQLPPAAQNKKLTVDIWRVVSQSKVCHWTRQC